MKPPQMDSSRMEAKEKQKTNKNQKNLKIEKNTKKIDEQDNAHSKW